MKILSIIPARKGSKGIVGKNKRKLGNKPLISYTLDVAALLPKNFKNIISTDDEEIIEISKNYKIENNGLRPKKLSEDNSLTIDVLKYELLQTEKKHKCIFDGVLLLQPTCPFRKVEDIKSAYEIFKNNNNLSVVSVADVEGNHPFRMKIIKNGMLENFIDQGFEDMRPRQELPEVYIRSGSIYLTSRENIINNRLVGDKVYPIIMDDIFTINIDKELDFNLAENLLHKFLKK